MSVAQRKAVDAYARVSIETATASADPHRLILMLFDGAQAAIAQARGHMQRSDIAAKGEALSKAIAIIENGLKASLDLKAGGELAERLCALYEYMTGRLLLANVHNRVDLLDEVARLLGELRDAWIVIAERGARPAAVGA